MAVQYQEISNASLATVLSTLEDRKIAKDSIVNLFYAESLYIAVFAIA